MEKLSVQEMGVITFYTRWRRY